MTRDILVPLLCTIALSIPARADRQKLVSQRRDGAIVADGKFDDWYGALEPLGDHPVSIQALNDGEFLYLRLTASATPMRMMIMRQGFTVWFDPAGGTKKKLGIRYPVVEEGAGYVSGRQQDHPASRVEILGPGKDDARSLTRDHLGGIEVAIGVDAGLLQYELKVPLVQTADHPYAIATEPGKTIGLGFETGKLEQRHMSEGGRGGGFGGMGGRGGGMGGHGGGRSGGGGGGGDRGAQSPKPLKVWTLLAIAPVR